MTKKQLHLQNDPFTLYSSMKRLSNIHEMAATVDNAYQPIR